MAFRGWKRLLLLGRQNALGKVWRSRRGGPSLRWKRCCHWSAGKSLDPEVRAFLEENTEVTNSGHLTPEIRLRLLTPRCRFWREKPDLWPYGDPFWAIYWPGGQALSSWRFHSIKSLLFQATPLGVTQDRSLTQEGRDTVCTVPGDTAASSCPESPQSAALTQ
uniref:Electron transfer flavoprotein subunit beta lysine methyltransferase n=1 Tax=Corvus moneduloides TaxID=1196302 RepID=A0A8C3EI60_CORMO